MYKPFYVSSGALYVSFLNFSVSQDVGIDFKILTFWKKFEISEILKFWFRSSCRSGRSGDGFDQNFDRENLILWTVGCLLHHLTWSYMILWTCKLLTTSCDMMWTWSYMILHDPTWSYMMVFTCDILKKVWNFRNFEVLVQIQGWLLGSRFWSTFWPSADGKINVYLFCFFLSQKLDVEAFLCVLRSFIRELFEFLSLKRRRHWF